MRVEHAFEGDGHCEQERNTYCVYSFNSRRDVPGASNATELFDLSECTPAEVHQWASSKLDQRRMITTDEWQYAVTLVMNDPAEDRGRGLIWLYGYDANVGYPDEFQQRLLNEMGS